MGTLYLEVIVDRMKQEFNVDANVGQPQVAYRETIKRVGLRLKVNISDNQAVVVSMATFG